MEYTFFSYLQRLELITFFSGYPLVFAIIFFIAGNQPSNNKWKGKLFFLLPFAYALVGTLYLGYQLKSLYPDYTLENIKQSLYHPFLMAWALSSLLFWIPRLAKKPVISLLHSFVFFFLLLKDLFFQLPAFETDKNIARNDMKLYTNSLLLNMAAIIAITLIYAFLSGLKGRKKSPAV
jgi:hypothetical protein